MLKRLILTAAVALAAVSVVRPAAANPRFVEPYTQIFQARTFLCTPADARPKDALHAAPSDKSDPRQRFLVSPYLRDDDVTFYAGIGFGYANAKDEWHPWGISASYFHGDFDTISENFDGFDVQGKYVLWQPADVRLPVVSVVGAAINFGHLGTRYDALIAVDERITNRIYATANVGYGHLDSDIRNNTALVTGFGLVGAVTPRFTLAADYIPYNAVEGEDIWGIGGIWAIDRTSIVKFGGGKNHLLYFNYIAKFDK